MKKLFFFPIAVLLLFTSCIKEEILAKLSDAEIANTIETALKSSDGGISITIEEAAKMAANNLSECGEVKDTSITRTDPQEKYTMTSNWNWKLNCEGRVPSNIDFTLSGNSTFNGSKLAMTASIPGSLVVSNLVSGDNFTMKGELSKNGNSILTTRNEEKKYSSNITINITDIAVNKTNYDIASGSATVKMDGTIDNGSSYSRTASLTFNGNGTATLLLDNGSSFTIQL